MIAPAAKHYFLFGFLLTIHRSLQGRKLTTLRERQSVYPKKVSELLAQLLTKTQVDKLPEATKPLEQMAEQGKAWPLIEGSGTIYGMYVIEGLNLTETEFFRDGMPRRIEFSLSLKRVDESLSDMFGDLSTQLNNLQDTATSALSDISKTVGGLLS